MNAPVKLMYMVGVMRGYQRAFYLSTVYTYTAADALGASPAFVRWLSDWVEVTV